MLFGLKTGFMERLPMLDKVVFGNKDTHLTLGGILAILGIVLLICVGIFGSIYNNNQKRPRYIEITAEGAQIRN